HRQKRSGCHSIVIAGRAVALPGTTELLPRALWSSNVFLKYPQPSAQSGPAFWLRHSRPQPGVRDSRTFDPLCSRVVPSQQWLILRRCPSSVVVSCASFLPFHVSVVQQFVEQRAIVHHRLPQRFSGGFSAGSTQGDRMSSAVI